MKKKIDTDLKMIQKSFKNISVTYLYRLNLYQIQNNNNDESFTDSVDGNKESKDDDFKNLNNMIKPFLLLIKLNN